METNLTALLCAEISAQGPMPFRRFMELALYHPQHGYYASGRARVGRGGDFMTNVSVGPLYGRLLARQFAEMWSRLGEPGDFAVVEQGAHGGELAGDVLAGLRELAPACFAAATYRIVEPSAALAAQQQRRLAGWGSKAQWSDSLPSFVGVHFSNELPDAFPVHRVRWTGSAWCELAVIWESGRFLFTEAPMHSAELIAACAQIPQPLPPGYTTEVNLAARAWIAEVAARLVRGYVLCVDYGYEREDFYALERAAGTLSAYAQHRREPDPLARPGEVDLTAHVEWTSLIEAAQGAGLTLAGFTDQHHCMVGLGAEHFAEGANLHETRAFQTLMHPQFMGAAFKVLALAKAAPLEPKLSALRYARP